MSELKSSKNMSNGSVHKTDCFICTETVSYSRMVKCPFCDFESCNDCVTRFLLGILDTNPRCMNNSCKRIWSWEFLAQNTHHSFHNKKYRERRAELLFEREKSMIPGTQELVRQEKKKISINRQISEIKDKNVIYRELIRSNNEKIQKLLQTGTGDNKKKGNIFTRACPVEECRGFLSTSLKCGTCSTYSCKDCHMPKAGKLDDDHKCDPDLVATVKMLSNDTKPCPACATPIFKISGCDQMYCTSCHTPFSWTKGTIETGVIHNPHYYQMQRELNGGVAPRNRGDIRCGGAPAMWRITDKLLKAQVEFVHASQAHRSITHINNVEIPRFPNQLGEADNSRLRVSYLMNEIDEKTWKSKLKAKMKKQEKNGEINQILHMYTQTLSDIFGNIIKGPTDDVYRHVASCGQLRDYTNKQLANIGIRFNNVVPCIGPDWEFYSNSKRVGPQPPSRPIYKSAPLNDRERQTREQRWNRIQTQHTIDVERWEHTIKNGRGY